MGEGMPAPVTMVPAGTTMSPAASSDTFQTAPPGVTATRAESAETATDLFGLLLTNTLPTAATPSHATSRLPPEDDTAVPVIDTRSDRATDPLLMVLAQVLPQALPEAVAPRDTGTDGADAMPARLAPTQVAATPAASASRDPATPFAPIADAGDAAGAMTLAVPANTPLRSRNSPAGALPRDSTVPSAPGAATAVPDANASLPASDGLPVAFELPRLATASEPRPESMPSIAAAQGPAPHVATLSGATTPAMPAQSVPQPTDPSAGYDDSFATQVTWLAEQRIGEAQIRISPEHLGAIDIRLQLDGRDVRAEFHSAQPEVRQALEASLPRLRDMLGQHGLQLAHAGVGHGQKQRDGAPFAQTPGATSREEGDTVPPPGFRRTRGLLDVYA